MAGNAVQLTTIIIAIKNDKIKLGKIEGLIKVLTKFYVYTNSSNYKKYSKIYKIFTKRTTLYWQMKVKTALLILAILHDDASPASFLFLQIALVTSFWYFKIRRCMRQ